MNKLLISFAVGFLLVSSLVGCVAVGQVLDNKAKEYVDSYVDHRIQTAIYQERLFIYEDLDRLFPGKIAYTRRGSPYVEMR